MQMCIEGCPMSSLTAIFAYFIKKSADHFVDYFVGHSVVLLGLSRSFLIFQRRASIVEITAIRENRIAPGIISESYFFGGDGGSRTHVQEHFRKTFSERSRLLLFRSPFASAANSGFRYPVDTLTLPGDHARGPCMHDAGFPCCR